MLYNGPFDQPGDPNAVYVDGNSRTGVPGSIPPAAAFEHPQRELVNLFTKCGLTPTNDDLDQLSRSFQNLKVCFAQDTGTANSMSATFDPVIATRVVGMTLRIKKSAAANSGPVTLNIGLGNDQVVRMGGAAMNAGDLPANCVMTVIWDGTKWQTKNFLGRLSSSSTTTNNFIVDIPYVADTSPNANHIIAPFSPAITSISAGKLVLVKLAQAFTGGPVDIAVNSLAIINVKRGDLINPMVGDGATGQILLLEYDGAQWQIVNTSTPARPLPLIIVDEKPQGVHGGTFTSGSWRTRDLNSIRADPFSLTTLGYASLSANRFTLAAGQWECRIRAPALGGTKQHQHRLWNVTDNVIALKSTFSSGSISSPGWGVRGEYDHIEGLINISGQKTFEVQGKCLVTLDNYGFGSALGATEGFWQDISHFQAYPDPGPEVYTVVSLIKVS